MSNSFERKLTAQIEKHLPGATPGLQLQVYRKGEKACNIALGETYPFYDLASLTKIIFTVPALMAAYERGLWTFDTALGELWPDFPAPEVKLTQLLCHAGGALWWHPFYKEIDLSAPIDV